MKVVFVHPDLGLGGAEQLITQLAYGLQLRNHKVVVYTNYFNPNRCFEESGSLTIVQKFNLPNSFFNYGHVFFAWFKFMLLSLYIYLYENCDALVVDQISIANPILKRKAPLYFYCHYPDMLLTNRNSVVKTIYRWPFDTLERISTNSANFVFVNSNYTKQVYIKTFGDRQLCVLYPGTRYIKYTGPNLWETKQNVILSINRFERKKRIDRAIKAFKKIETNAILIIAGGYDLRIAENIDYLVELELLCKELNLTHTTIKGTNSTLIPCDTQVVFITSFTDDQKHWMLSHSKLLLYTPSNEHFGIVPIEAMAYGLPTIAMKSGGPMETVVHGESGFLCTDSANVDVMEMANYASIILENKQLWTDLSRFCKTRHLSKFSINAMMQAFEEIILS
eukprot:NODE_34_length_31639_cov_0.254375.p4 type:complete len:393 gc:universal NODE_34_length_31639_cov_0.254375:24402-25580(+)